MEKKDALLVNKVVAAVLLAGLLMFAIGYIAVAFYHPEDKPDVAGYAIKGGEENTQMAATATDSANDALPSILPALASADVAAGEKVLKKCTACHTFDDGGANKVGPNLYNIVNADKAAVAGFKYSNALKDFGGVWDYDALNAFFYKPKDYVKGTKMGFAGLKKESDRANIIAYLRSLSPSPAPIYIYPLIKEVLEQSEGE